MSSSVMEPKRRARERARSRRSLLESEGALRGPDDAADLVS